MPLILLVLSALAVTAVSRRLRLRLPAPLTLVVAELAISAIPGVPDYQLDPELVLFGILPPLLYSAALDSSAIQIRANIRPIALLAVGLVLFSTACVGLVAWWLVPGLPLGAAMALAAVVAPTDAVAAVSIGRRLGLPRRMMTVLTGESLFNDATALTALRVAVAVHRRHRLLAVVRAGRVPAHRGRRRGAGCGTRPGGASGPAAAARREAGKCAGSGDPVRGVRAG